MNVKLTNNDNIIIVFTAEQVHHVMEVRMFFLIYLRPTTSRCVCYLFGTSSVFVHPDLRGTSYGSGVDLLGAS